MRKAKVYLSGKTRDGDLLELCNLNEAPWNHTSENPWVIFRNGMLGWSGYYFTQEKAEARLRSVADPETISAQCIHCGNDRLTEPDLVDGACFHCEHLNFSATA